MYIDMNAVDNVDMYLQLDMPRILVASDLGSVVSCGLKTDAVLAEYRDGHCGTVHSVHRSQSAVIVTCCNQLCRNPLYSKMFLTAGDRSVKIWSEDVRGSSVMVGQAGPSQVPATVARSADS